MTIEKKIQKLTQQALKYLSFRARSEKELRDYLGKKTEDLRAIDAVIAEIDRFNLLNDESFSKQWASSRLRKGKGPVVIRLELKQKGIDPHIIEDLLASLDDKAVVDSAREQAEKKARLLKTEAGFKRRQQMQRYLYSRGFPLDVINQIIDDSGLLAVQ